MKKSIEITPNIATLFGTRDENLHVLEDGLNINIDLRSDSIDLEGAARDVARAEQVFADYDHLQRAGHTFNNGDLNSMLRVLTADPKATLRGLAEPAASVRSDAARCSPRALNQRRYFEAIEKHDMVFGIGPAGTGKTYLAVAMAISALLAKRVNRIILARPAVEAGERLGFLPGTLQDKIDPYLRPLYDALYDMLDPEKVDRYLEKNVIEIAPHRIHARTHAERFVRHSRRGAEHHFGADEDVRHAAGVQLQGRDHRRRYADRFAQCAAQRTAGGGRNSEAVEGLASFTSTKATWCGIIWCSASFAPTTSTRTRLRNSSYRCSNRSRLPIAVVRIARSMALKLTHRELARHRPSQSPTWIKGIESDGRCRTRPSCFTFEREIFAAKTGIAQARRRERCGHREETGAGIE